MLVLTRKSGQAILIGDDIEIAVVEVRGDQVRLGIRAPRDIKVLRREVLEQITAENVEAAAAGVVDLDAFSGLGASEEIEGGNGGPVV